MSIPLQNRRIMLVGGAGFIGHNLALHLKARGADVCIVDGLEVNNLISLMANTDNVPHPDLSLAIIDERMRLLRNAGVTLFVQDAREYHALSRLIHDVKPQTLIHLAAVSHANRSNKTPYHTFDHSLRTLENALDGAREHAEHFIYLSSSMVYGDFKTGVVDEETYCEPKGIYGALKFSGEKIVMAYNQVFDLPYTIIRPSALYGERCISRRVSQIFIENALMGEDITINGDGSDALDFTYIQDFVEGVIGAIQTPAARNQIFNLTYGAAQPINQMVSILRDYFPDVGVILKEKDALMPDRGTLSVDKARRLMGYDPKWSLIEGFPRYIEWYKAFFEEHGSKFQR
ncbi:NAD(P)-dependent oxidoreductase [Magnetospira sp. QH-2]|uniref:NAD-dependent epimerase/dehydratase family protein n=1 Tax=Magnetospira sp. (strain QH-2) TaxID=1288970 RepID=UPI0003E80E38|nr:NAD(P)-dependent oxidoreductase [Magnetospira sp. QH-2]CCQ73083.1 putative dTDP-glucose 4,6-dehydratase [Magnetospira sp. QH-2]